MGFFISCLQLHGSHRQKTTSLFHRVSGGLFGGFIPCLLCSDALHTTRQLPSSIMPPRKKRQNEYYTCSGSSSILILHRFIHSISYFVNNIFTGDFFFRVDITLQVVNLPVKKENLAKKHATGLHAIIVFKPDTVPAADLNAYM